MNRMWTGPRLLPVAALVTLSACGGDAPPPPPPPTVSVATPLQRDVVDWDDYTGRFEAIDDVDVRPRVNGVVTRIHFTDGQDVRVGQPLFTIDPRPYAAALEQARAEVASARASLTNAQAELRRATQLVSAQAVSRQEFESRQANTRTAEAALASARALVTQRRLDLDFTTVRSPIRGRVSDRRVSIGDYVANGQTTLTRVVSVNPIWFRFEGAESLYLKYLRQDRKGERGSSRYAANPVDIGLADEAGYRWRGRMNFLDNAIDPQSGTISAHAVVPNPDGFLTPGMYGRARLLGSGTYKAMLVPQDAVQTDQTRKLVMVLDREKKTTMRPVELGPIVLGLRVVKAGLSPTDLVIVEGAARVRPGSPVTPKRTTIKPIGQDDVATSRPVLTPPVAEATSAAR